MRPGETKLGPQHMNISTEDRPQVRSYISLVLFIRVLFRLPARGLFWFRKPEPSGHVQIGGPG